MHIAVLPREITKLVKDIQINIGVDFTFGAGGHSKIILENMKNQNGKLVSLDRDITTKQFALPLEKIYEKRFMFYVDISYNMDKYVDKIDFILGDLGLSQMQLNESRGFSYKTNSPLNMQMGVDSLGSLSSFITTLSEYKIGEILREYGEEHQWRKIAAEIHTHRRSIYTTHDLKSIIEKVVKKDLNKALSRCFQAFRIFINQEFLILDKTLKVAYELLNNGGTMAIITFHSLEDRIVKTFFKSHLKELQLIMPQEDEVESNPQSRSAKLRIGKKIL